MARIDGFGGKLQRLVMRAWRLSRRPLRDQLLVLRAIVLLAHSRYLIKKKGLAAIEPMLGRRMGESPQTVPPGHEDFARKVSWAVCGSGLYTPWTSNCFPQALAAQRLLRRESIDCTVYFGAVRRASEEHQAAAAGEVGAFAAHAWTRVGATFVTGADVKDLYQPMVSFAQ